MLVALLLPAVQSARKAARRTQCLNGVKQLCLALQNYHDSRKSFPSSVELEPSNNTPAKATVHQPNWGIRILPYIEQSALYDSFDLTKPISDPDPLSRNYKTRGTTITVMLCPSDSFNSESLFQGRKTEKGENWARGNYGANAALGFMSKGNRPAGGPETKYWQDSQTRGVMGLNVGLSIAQITDGTSHTMLIGELRAGINDRDPRGTWALGAHGSSSLWGHGTDNDIGPNSCTPGGDGIMACAGIKAAAGGKIHYWRNAWPVMM